MDYVSGITTESACGLILFQDDAIAVDVDLERIFVLQRQSPSQFAGKNNSAEFIEPSDKSGRFHGTLLNFHGDPGHSQFLRIGQIT